MRRAETALNLAHGIPVRHPSRTLGSTNSNRKGELLNGHIRQSSEFLAARCAGHRRHNFVAAGVGIHAQTQKAPYSLFQYSTLTGSGNTITATRVAVVTPGGNTIYKNVTLRFDVDPDGNLTLSPDHPQLLIRRLCWYPLSSRAAMWDRARS